MTEGRVNKLVFDGNMGVWVSYRSTSHLTLYHSSLYVPLLSIDFLSLLPPSLHNPDMDQVSSPGSEVSESEPLIVDSLISKLPLFKELSARPFQ